MEVHRKRPCRTVRSRTRWLALLVLFAHLTVRRLSFIYCRRAPSKSSPVSRPAIEALDRARPRGLHAEALRNPFSALFPSPEFAPIRAGVRDERASFSHANEQSPARFVRVRRTKPGRAINKVFRRGWFFGRTRSRERSENDPRTPFLSSLKQVVAHRLLGLIKST